MAHFIERLTVSNNIFKEFLLYCSIFYYRRSIASSKKYHINNETLLFACLVFNLKNNDNYQKTLAQKIVKRSYERIIKHKKLPFLMHMDV